MRKKSKKHRKTVSLAGYKLNSIKNTISKALTHAEISHEELELVGNKTKKDSRLKEN